MATATDNSTEFSSDTIEFMRLYYEQPPELRPVLADLVRFVSENPDCQRFLEEANRRCLSLPRALAYVRRQTIRSRMHVVDGGAA